MSASFDPSRVDDLLAAVGRVERRRILAALAARPPDASVEMGEMLGDDAGTAERVAIYHAHLPKLEDAGLVDWDEDARRVHRGPRFADVEPLVGFLDEYPAAAVDGTVGEAVDSRADGGGSDGSPVGE